MRANVRSSKNIERDRDDMDLIGSVGCKHTEMTQMSHGKD